MQNIRTKIKSVATLMAALSLLVSVPVFADATASNTTTAPTTDTTTTTSTSAATPTTSTDAHARGAKLLAEAQAKLKNQKAKSQTERQKVCDSRKTNLTSRINNLSSSSDKIQAKIDDALTKAQSYHTTKNIDPTNYDQLLATATSDQSASASSIAAMKAVQPSSIDCTSSTVASTVATFKAAAQQTHDNLKDYRDAVKALLVALSDTKKAATTPTGGN